MRISVLVFTLLLSASVSRAQFSGPTGQQRADKVQDEFDKTVPPPIRQQPGVDFEKLKSDADELMILSQSIHSGVANVGKGMLPKDLIDKLKQVEKISKRLRGELGP